MSTRRHSATLHPGHRSPATLFVVALGGALGTLARYSLDRALPTGTGHFPAATLAINLSGSFLIGLLLPWTLSMADRHPWIRPLLITGLLGGWTTYSALATDAATLTKTGHPLLAAADLGATVLGGLALVALGYVLGPSRRAAP
jgi:fluoride exporter